MPWPMKPMRRRVSVSRGSLPKMRTLPRCAFEKPAMMRSSVVFPAPLRPISARHDAGLGFEAGYRAGQGNRRNTSRRPQRRPRSLRLLRRAGRLERGRAARSRAPECRARGPESSFLVVDARHDLLDLRADSCCRGLGCAGADRPAATCRAGHLESCKRSPVSPKICACVRGSTPRSFKCSPVSVTPLGTIR